MTQTFAQFGFKPFIDAALKEIGFKEPTEVQARLIPLILKRRSVVGQSQTGSGKTHTFLLPIFQTIDPELTEVQAVITTPSRELAYQIYDAAKQIAKHSEKEFTTMLAERINSARSKNLNTGSRKSSSELLDACLI